LRQFNGRHAVWLTRAATFADKASLFPGAVFVVGVDTAERILAPRFYPEAVLGRDMALEHLRRQGCRFLVAARIRVSVEARRVSEGEAQSLAHASGFGANQTDLQTVHDLDIPSDFHDIFQELPASVFRLDISSTHLRQSGGQFRG
jgi:hypothetical protein